MYNQEKTHCSDIYNDTYLQSVTLKMKSWISQAEFIVQPAKSYMQFPNINRPASARQQQYLDTAFFVED